MKHTVTEVELSNGAKGLLIHIPGATVMNYEFNFRAGHYLVKDPLKWEIPHIMEHLVLNSNKKYPDSRKFSIEFQKNGAYTNAYTSYVHVSYIGEVADFEWERVMKLQLIAIGQPLFLQKEFKAEWGNIHDELNSYHNNHFRHLGTELENSFGYNLPTDIERARIMSNVTRKDVVDFYEYTHNFPNLRFVIAGNIGRRKNKILKLIEQTKISKTGERFERPLDLVHPQRKPVFIPNETVKNIYFMFDVSVNHPLTDEQMDTMSIVEILLTGTLHSLIFGKAREKGLVYSMNSGASRSAAGTNWSIIAEVLPKNAPAVIEIIVDEIQKIMNGKIDLKELESAKQYAYGQYQRRIQTVGKVSSLYGRYFNDEVISDVPNTKQRIESVTAERITEAFKELFSEKIAGIGVLGGKSPKLTEQLQKQVAVLWE